jgi:cystathionine beta-lyase
MPTAPFEALTEIQLRARASLKWQHYGPDVLPLWVAEMDVLPAPAVVEALTAAVRDGDTGYPRSTLAYAEAFAGFAERRWGWAPDPALTTPCADVMTGIRVLIEALVPSGGPVVIPSPVYPPFAAFTRELGREVVPVVLTERGRLDVPAIGEALTRLAAQGRRRRPSCCAVRTTRPAWSTPQPSWPPWPRRRGWPGPRSSATRCTARWPHQAPRSRHGTR